MVSSLLCWINLDLVFSVPSEMFIHYDYSPPPHRPHCGRFSISMVSVIMTLCPIHKEPVYTCDYFLEPILPLSLCLHLMLTSWAWRSCTWQWSKSCVCSRPPHGPNSSSVPVGLSSSWAPPLLCLSVAHCVEGSSAPTYWARSCGGASSFSSSASSSSIQTTAKGPVSRMSWKTGH